jgi:hypothetical protein
MKNPDELEWNASQQRCGACSHFNNAVASIEPAIHGLRVMGSAYSSVRSNDGICAVHDKYLSAQHGCLDFLQTKPAA